MTYKKVQNSKILVTGGAGFIGSNLCESLLKSNNEVVCFDNLETGHFTNVAHLTSNSNFKFILGDIRKLEDCKKAVEGCDYVLHEAALGSVPRSLKDPIISNETNVSGFLNMLVASRDEKVKKFVYAASSSTYGDSESLPKVEDKIGNPLSPYAITKYVNELYATIFSEAYGLETIGLRYFNVYGRKQDPNGAYAAVIPKFVMKLMNLESPTINGDGSFSRDFTYIDNVIQMNNLALLANNNASNTVYNCAHGERTDLNELTSLLKENLAEYRPEIKDIKILHGPERAGDIPHSHANIDKAKNLLGYNPIYTFREGLKEATKWYFENLK